MFDELKDAIRNQDKEGVARMLTETHDKIAAGDADVINGIVTPSEITELHNLLTEHLGVHPKTMMVKGRITTRGRRASLFCRAMLNGVSRVS